MFTLQMYCILCVGGVLKYTGPVPDTKHFPRSYSNLHVGRKVVQFFIIKYLHFCWFSGVQKQVEKVPRS